MPPRVRWRPHDAAVPIGQGDLLVVGRSVYAAYAAGERAVQGRRQRAASREARA